MEPENIQSNSDLYVESGFWKLRRREAVGGGLAPELPLLLAPVWIGPATGPERLTKRQAHRAALECLTAPRPQPAPTPRFTMTLAAFVEKVFLPEHVAAKGLAGRTHYRAILKHILAPEEVDRLFRSGTKRSKANLRTIPGWPYLGETLLSEARPEAVERLVVAAVERGYSTQTVKHIRNVVGAIFTYAGKSRYFIGENPATAVSLPPMTRKVAHALTLDQARRVLAAMRYPEREIALIAMLTSMSVAEICGLQWKYVNLTGTTSYADGEPIPAWTIAVRNECYRGQVSVLPKSKRRCDHLLPSALLPVLLELGGRGRFTGPECFVLVSSTGTPVIEKNLAARRLKPLGIELGMPWLSWQVFRRTHRALAGELADLLRAPMNSAAQ